MIGLIYAVKYELDADCRNGQHMRLTKIYTKTGDKGETRLSDGSQVKKSNIRINAYGTVDELNAQMGLLCASLPQKLTTERLVQMIRRIQNELFDVGAELSTPGIMDSSKSWTIPKEAVDRLEAEIDHMNSHLAPLMNFILPAGSPCIAQAHVARTVCRRSERIMVELNHQESIRPLMIQYVNRLSDWLFVYSRYLNHLLGQSEILWEQQGQR